MSRPISQPNRWHFAAIATTSTDRFVRFDVTNLVKSWIAGSGTNNGIAVNADPSGGGVELALDSKENTATSHPAVLHIELVDQGPAGPKGDNPTPWWPPTPSIGDRPRERHIQRRKEG